MNKISTDRPETFIEAVQLLFSFHCCLHLTGEPTSIGRLDQLLEPFLKGTPAEEAQEIIDCLFIKLCEHVHLNTRLLNDLGAWGMTAVVYCSTGMFPNGDTINQWVQQVRMIRCNLYEGLDAIMEPIPLRVQLIHLSVQIYLTFKYNSKIILIFKEALILIRRLH